MRTKRQQSIIVGTIISIELAIHSLPTSSLKPQSSDTTISHFAAHNRIHERRRNTAGHTFSSKQLAQVAIMPPIRCAQRASLALSSEQASDYLTWDRNLRASYHDFALQRNNTVRINRAAQRYSPLDAISEETPDTSERSSNISYHRRLHIHRIRREGLRRWVDWVMVKLVGDKALGENMSLEERHVKALRRDLEREARRIKRVSAQISEEELARRLEVAELVIRGAYGVVRERNEMRL